MKARLISLSPTMPRTAIVLKKLPVVVGRSPDAHVRVDDRWTSRIHCEISQLEGTLVVRDRESRNGTLVNGEQIREALLMPGDRLTVGITTFQVQYRRRKTEAPVAIGHSASHW